jgi:hypothetical protein
MIRVLLMIAGAGFVLSVVTIATAVAIGGPEAIARGAWGDYGWHGRDWDRDSDDRHARSNRTDLSGPETTRELAWTGGDSLELDVPAELTYTQAPGPAKLVITGPRGAVERVEVEGGRIGLERGRLRHGRLYITMTAPDVSRFELNGSDRLIIRNYRQDRLTLTLSGDAEVEASGETQTMNLGISGRGEADLGQLRTREANVEISGSGDARIAPTEAADLEISGAGDVTLLTRPARLESDISGSGSIHQEGGARPPSEGAPA